ncbi:sulfurtransferase [Planococcus sp. N028]|uniref:Sulfurtransferase n=1 Tax=Planococcus shixiaomingii TaxID=3058393 RepID=A0ABT8MZL5_9BACL|nr:MULTISPECIES: sulfurtransferase [unclassified Planococcus (in: firmicutes)]MDN7241068.1 sulfurtransferase [Planococcus sp. N028]WKA53322.1 sulfurtransferase [Planococcus sp. N022]
MSVFIETTDTENYRWIDARFELGKPEQGRNLYEQEHVAGAVFWDLEKDLSDMEIEGGRHPMPSKDQLTRLVRSSGLTSEDRVVIYDQGGSPFAARAWWLLKYAGFEQVFISKHGFSALKNKGIAVSAAVPEYEPTFAELQFDDSLYADRNYVKSIIAGKELGILIDARSAERYAGINEPLDKVAGRIPGARNFDWAQLVHNQEFYEDVDFSEVLQKNEPAVVYCGSGVSAAALYTVLAEKGHHQLRLYTGSFSDWINDEENVVEIDRSEHPEAADEETKAILAHLIQEGYTGEMLMKKFEFEKSQLEKK